MADRYGGIRVTLTGVLAHARCPVQVDVGFGDAVTPGPETVRYPTLLPDLPKPQRRAYPRETVVAEKLEADIPHAKTCNNEFLFSISRVKTTGFSRSAFSYDAPG
jgi:hypothetical protein